MLKRITHVIAGFVGGIAFLISCGGGGTGDTVTAPIQTVNAGPVISSQMYCAKTSPQLINANTTPFGGTASDPFPESLFCINSAGNPSQLSIQGAFLAGWKIQSFDNSEIVFYQ